MAWDSINLRDLDASLLTEAQETLIQLAAERLPDMDFRRGAMRSQLISPLAMLLTAQQTLAQKLLDSQSILHVLSNSGLYDADLITALLSNYRISRKSGHKVTGTILCIFDELQPVTVYSGTIFETDAGIKFTTTQTVRGRTSAATVILSNDQLLTLRSDGTYGLLLSVEAVDVGSSSNISADTELTLDTAIVNFVAAYANGDFTGGIETETVNSMLRRLQTGISTRVFSNRNSLLGLINDEYPDVAAVSVIGMGDAEMSRDQRLLLPISGGGRADIYVRSAATPVHYSATLPATFVALPESSPAPDASPAPIASPDPDTIEYGTWQINIGRTVAPGFYAIVSIKPENPTATVEGYDIVSEEYDVDLDVDFYASDIENALEGAFSPFQTATVQFLETDTNVFGMEPGTVQYYEVTLLYLPLIEDIHSYLTQRSIRPPATDLLVKAVVPNIIKLDISIDARAGLTIDTAALSSVLADYVNNKAIGTGLKNTEIAAELIPLLGASTNITDILISSRIILPDHTEDVVENVAEITTIDEPELYSTQRTIALMLSADDVVINVNYPELSVDYPW